MNYNSDKLYDIVTFGEILIDFTSEGINENGQKIFAQNPGGAPANVAVCAKRLGANTSFVGKVGDDMHGHFLKNVLEQEGVDTKGMVVDKDYFTTLAFVDISDTGERSFSFARKPGADTQITESELNQEVLNNAKIFHVGSLSLTNEPSKTTTFYAVKKAKENNSIISYDPNYRASLWENEDIAKSSMRSLIPYVDIMKISDEEVELLTGQKDIEKGAQILFNQGVKLVTITLGSKGAYVYFNNRGKIISGYKSKVVDTTGAGDSFWGGLLYNISKTNKSLDDLSFEEIEEYINFANAVASICVERKGAIPAMPTIVEVENKIKK